MTGKRKIHWYGVRTLFRLVAVGKPKTTDRYFDPTSTLVEDRVVLFRADDAEGAIKQAEAEAAEYCKHSRFVNVYGQSVRLKFLGALDAYSLPEGDEPSAGCEVYSSTAITPRCVSNRKLIRERFGKPDKRGPRRYKFLDRDVLNEAIAKIGGKKSGSRMR